MKRIIQSAVPAVLACAILAGCPSAPSGDTSPGEETLLIFHNGTGPMCIEALAWLATMRSAHPDLAVEEHLTTDAAGLALFGQLKSQYGQSQGISTSFGYLPVIFFGGQAFSGFNDEVKQSLAGLIDAVSAPSS